MAFYIESGNQSRKLSNKSQNAALKTFFEGCANNDDARLGELTFVSKNKIYPDRPNGEKIINTEETATKLGFSVKPAKGKKDEGPRLTVFNG